MSDLHAAHVSLFRGVGCSTKSGTDLSGGGFFNGGSEHEFH